VTGGRRLFRFGQISLRLVDFVLEDFYVSLISLQSFLIRLAPEFAGFRG
jgi:hypothetical protein